MHIFPMSNRRKRAFVLERLYRHESSSKPCSGSVAVGASYVQKALDTMLNMQHNLTSMMRSR